MTEEAPPATLPRWALGAAATGWVSGMVCGGVLLGLWVAATGQDTRALGSLGVAQVGFWVGLLGAVVVTSGRGGTGSLVRDFGLRCLFAAVLAVGFKIHLRVFDPIFLRRGRAARLLALRRPPSAS